MSLNFDNLSVKELKAYLDEQQINYDGCFERSEFIQLAKGQIAPAAGSVDRFMQNIFGACGSLMADYEMAVRNMSVKELKAHLKERGIDTNTALYKEDLIELAVSGGSRDVRKLDAHHDMSEHLLEC